MTGPTAFCSASACSAIEGSIVECQPAGNGSGKNSIVKILYQETSIEDCRGIAIVESCYQVKTSESKLRKPSLE
jgi:hypothetical protein